MPDVTLDRRTVLLVTDDPSTARELGGVLGSSGARVRHAIDGGGALALLHAERIDALVCDLASRFDACGLMKEVRRELDPATRLIAAIAWSGSQSFLHLTPFRAAGAGFDVHLLTRAPHDTLVEYIQRLTDHAA